MLDIVQPPIARDITLNLKDGRGDPIVEISPPVERITVEAFVTKVFRGQQIEHVGRHEMLNINKYRDVLTSASLFFQAVHWAYACHHALGLRPEVLMYLINAVVAETVRRHPEDYRDLFTSRPGKMDIQVRHDDLKRGHPDSPWDEAIEMFDQALRAYVPSRIMNQMLPEFTTSNDEAQLASLIAFMDAASPYYDYWAMTLCGIPRIVLFGEARDYRRLHTAAIELAKTFDKHLSAYFAKLLPILDIIATTAETGQVDADFWGQLYKHYHASGSNYYTGWISCFLWYVHKPDWETRTRPLIVKNINGRIDTDSEPSQLSFVPFTWDYLGRSVPMRFIGGVLGVDVVNNALTPVLSYGVLRGA